MRSFPFHLIKKNATKIQLTFVAYLVYKLYLYLDQLPAIPVFPGYKLVCIIPVSDFHILTIP